MSTSRNEVPVVRRFFCPPEIPLSISSPTSVFAQISNPKIFAYISEGYKKMPKQQSAKYNEVYKAITPSLSFCLSGFDFGVKENKEYF